ncbi:hypothetical protein GT037_009203, partial [Alternaria burnsii]
CRRRCAKASHHRICADLSRFSPTRAPQVTLAATCFPEAIRGRRDTGADRMSYSQWTVPKPTR